MADVRRVSTDRGGPPLDIAECSARGQAFIRSLAVWAKVWTAVERADAKDARAALAAGTQIGLGL